jgi:hypothetical protein
MGILRQLFGPSRDEVWEQFARDIDASFEPGGYFGQSVIRVRTGEWVVTLDTYTVSTGKSSTTYTRLRAPYVNRDGFRFDVSRKHIFTGVAKFFGMQDVEIGDPWFDEEFVIQGTDVGRLQRFFANQRIRELLQAQPDVRLSVKDDEGWFGTTFPEGVDELHFLALGVIKDVDRLRGLFDLFAETLEELCRMGSAYERAPDVTL